jgi:hypothetical protein
LLYDGFQDLGFANIIAHFLPLFVIDVVSV